MRSPTSSTTPEPTDPTTGGRTVRSTVQGTELIDSFYSPDWIAGSCLAAAILVLVVTVLTGFSPQNNGVQGRDADMPPLSMADMPFIDHTRSELRH